MSPVRTVGEGEGSAKDERHLLTWGRVAGFSCLEAVDRRPDRRASGQPAHGHSESFQEGRRVSYPGGEFVLQKQGFPGRRHSYPVDFRTIALAPAPIVARLRGRGKGA